MEFDCADFGEDSDLKIWHSLIRGIAYSSNGRFLAVDTYDQTFIYANLGSSYSSLKRVRDFPGSFSKIASCPFSFDNKQIATTSGNQVSIWDIETGELLKKFDTDCKVVLGINLDMENTVIHKDEQVQVLSFKKIRGRLF